jgi:hypothetical protein
MMFGAWVCSMATFAHAQTGAAPGVLAAVGGRLELRDFIVAYLVGFAASVVWSGIAAFWRLRRDVRALRS